MRPNFSRSIADAAAGTRAWVAYGVAETLFVAALRFWRCLSEARPAPICGVAGDLTLPLLALIAYALIGALLGLIAGRRFVAITVIGAFLINAVMHGSRSIVLLLGFAIAILVLQWKARVLAAFAVVAIMLTVIPTPAPRSSTRVSSSRPNVILITLDTVRADHLSLYGYGRDTTPHLRQWPATVYRNAFSSSNWTLPGHASIFTGQSVSRHGAHESAESDFHPIATSSVTLPQLLSRQGYVTAGIVANYGNLSGPAGFERGFAYYDYVYPHGLGDPSTPSYLLRATLRNQFATIYALAPASEVNERATRFLKSTKSPFFLFLNYMDAHVPYGGSGAFAWDTYFDLAKRGRPLAPQQSQQLISLYDGAIHDLDEQLHQLFETLKRLNLYDNTLIVVTSDHGEAFGESPIVGHGRSLFQHQIHVPLIVKNPHANQRAFVDTPVSDVDILPLILGRPIPSDRWITSESYRRRDPRIAHGENRPAEIALIRGSMKVIVDTRGSIELYDLAADPQERVNLHGREPMPEGWEAALAACIAEANSQSPTPAVNDPEILRRLRALGYLH